jgi:hypothetical protein
LLLFLRPTVDAVGFCFVVGIPRLSASEWQNGGRMSLDNGSAW